VENWGATGESLACEESPVASTLAVRQILAKVPEVDGIVTINEEALPFRASEFARASREMPDDVSICSVVAAHRAMDVVPPISACDVPLAEMCRDAMGMLISRLGTRVEPEHRLITPPLTVRASSGPAQALE
jgi:DNA-binding LacI/PurR family transcriptional regulator